MRFQFDPNYISGAVVLAILSAIIAVLALLWAASEISYWMHPYSDGHLNHHFRSLGIALLLFFLGARWLVVMWKRRQKGQ